jgi:hypothetical protein
MISQDELEIPSNLRPKLAGMDSTVKAAMLKSSQVITLNPVPPHVAPRRGGLRKTRSSESLGSPKQLSSPGEWEVLQPPPTAALFGALHHASSIGSPASGHSRGVSFDGSRSFSRGEIRPMAEPMKLTKEKNASVFKDISPTKFFSILSGTSSTQLDVEILKKLRLLLRNESAT